MGFIIKTPIQINKICECGKYFIGSNNSRYCKECKKNKNRKKVCKRCYKELYFTSVQYCDECLKINYIEQNKKHLDKIKKYYKDNFEKNRINPEKRIKNINNFKNWYENNKEKQKEYISKNYNNNKLKCSERGYVAYHRKELLKLINKKCPICKSKNITQIHHKKYDNLPRENLREYSKFLIGFCSKLCHQTFEHNLPKLENKIS